MRRLILILFIAFGCLFSRADEGMWLPNLLESYTLSEMQKLGLRLTAEDIYSINKSSLKDAIVLFGRGCTGEVVSDQGLLLTNHHCGHGNIQQHSSLENDYLTNGFWAKTRAEELPNPGLTVSFVVRIEDVTAKVLEGITDKMPEGERQLKINSAIAKIEKEAVKGTNYTASVRPFYYGNEYYLFVFEVFKDVRLVGAPPSGIGNFGGDTDNWMWPRHTGDFCVFRIYANKNNEPAPYSPDNVPYKPKKHLKISLKGVKENDFTWVYGFPGQTEEYLPSYAIRMTLESENPAKILCRSKRLEIMKQGMESSPLVRIQYASKFAGVANAHKKWIGESLGLQRFEVIAMKEAFEKEFQKWVEANPERKEQYGTLLKDFEELYKKLTPINLYVNYYYEAIMGIEVLRFASRFAPLVNLYNDKSKSDAQVAVEVEKLKQGVAGFFKNYNADIDRRTFAEMIKIYIKNVSADFHPAELKEALQKAKNDPVVLADELFRNSVFVNEAKLNECLNGKKKALKPLVDDLALKLVTSITTLVQSKLSAEYTELNNKSDLLMRKYMQAMRQMQPERRFYPDANSTLRVSYGQVKSVKPADAVTYRYYTTINGVLEKENPDIYDYSVPAKLKELVQKKDYGPYAYDGELRLCFIATNHTTGGNSGSPVLNADGELIGLNFDRIWEGTMSDLYYNPAICRNIVVDIKYVLFVIDKVAGAKYLVDEMLASN